MTMPATAYRDEFETAEEFLAAVVAAGGRPSARADQRLRWASITGAGEIIPSDGGYAVPPDFALELIAGVEEFATVYPETDRQPVTKGNRIKLPTWDETSRAHGSRFGGLALNRTGEGEAITLSLPKFKVVELPIDKLAGAMGATAELVGDASATRAYTSRAFRSEAGTVIDSEIIDGSGTGGQMLGILRSGALITVAPESGQASATVRAENITKMWSRCWAPGQRKALWLYNQELTQQLFALADHGLVTFGDRPRMLGAPLIAHESCKIPGNVGDLILVVPSQFVVAEKPAELAQSLHIRYIEHEQAFRFIWRISGHPAWSSPLTPLNGMATVSPFVALGERL